MRIEIDTTCRMSALLLAVASYSAGGKPIGSSKHCVLNATTLA